MFDFTAAMQALLTLPDDVSRASIEEVPRSPFYPELGGSTADYDELRVRCSSTAFPGSAIMFPTDPILCGRHSTKCLPPPIDHS